MKISIIYYSMTGHSKKIANAIAGELSIEAYNVKNHPVIKDVDLLFIVGGIYGGVSHPNLIEFVETLKVEDVKKVALITSCCGGVTPQKEVRTILNKNNIEVIDNEYICRGNFLFFGMGHPNKKEIEAAVNFAKSLGL